MENPTPLPLQILEPFEYHKKLKAHFKSRKKTWNWFSGEKLKEQQIQEFKTNLLKNTYRMDRDVYPELYTTADEICKKLAIDAKVFIYQENNSTQFNAGISVINAEAHIMLSGNLLNLLTKEEMKALLAHELSHYLFYKIENEEYEIAQRIVLALANDSRSEDAIIETARIFQLYLELFCDAGALLICEDHHVVIRTLVKMNTGLSEVNPESYLEQAKEIMKGDTESSQHHTHPESYIRSLALMLRFEKDEEYFDKIKKMICGPLNLNSLDIFEQVEMSELTERLIQLIVRPKWINTASIMNLCTKYFSNFTKSESLEKIEAIAERIESAHDSVKEYACYVLLDFTMVDSDLEGLGMGHTLQIAELLSISKEYENIVRKELKLTARDFKQIQERVIKELEQLTEGKEDSIYNE
ncbi:hypothetical protein GCM10011506_01270 [Marivirga lumbricoides]|uniref:Peptidase M48 domain-containing protein n=1 Tax=Marivirga lumbricoides TaxID=1046115 RepID=A0ABQ1L8G7_9BACT|nr:hypothetical protein GCM10011506_01270 [Marivirga lumbricoides]